MFRKLFVLTLICIAIVCLFIAPKPMSLFALAVTNGMVLVTKLGDQP